MNPETVTAADRVPVRARDQDRSPSPHRELQRCRPNTGSTAKERDEDAFFTRRVLIEQDHDFASRLQRPYQRDPCSAHSDLLIVDRRGARAGPNRQQSRVENRMGKAAKDCRERDAEGCDAQTAEFPVATMRADDKCAFAF